jgi:MSHA pilin protein MshA
VTAVTNSTDLDAALGGCEPVAQEPANTADIITTGARDRRIGTYTSNFFAELTMIAIRNRGFTLIELVVVITILGILAAFAVPKFITLDTTARIATINGLAGSVRSAASLARGMSMASQNTASVAMEGATVTLVNSYPDATSNGIVSAVNTTTSGTDFTITAGSTAAGTATWTKVGAPTPGSCEVTYTPPSAAGSTPTITTVTSGC